jgi:hypothetical protein
MDPRQALGIGGSLVLAIGVFTPIVSVPVVGNINYFRNGSGDGAFVLGFAVLSLILTLRGNFHWLWTTGTAVIALLVGAFIRFQETLLEVQSGIERDLSDNPFRGVAEVAVGSAQLQWGWILLIIGAGALIAAASTRSRSGGLRRCPHCAELIQPQAVVCKHCGRDTPPNEAVLRPVPEPRRPRRVAIVTALTVIGVIVVMWTDPLLRLLIRLGVV